ncbi:MAG: FKBP-type peptidyl-prolyl cis-trans isomerase [Pseudomonadota bacterium]
MARRARLRIWVMAQAAGLMMAGGPMAVANEENRAMADTAPLSQPPAFEAPATLSGDTSAERGAAFLKANADADGVKVTASGLQYQVLRAGEGGASPTARDTVEVHYRGVLLDGMEFDSSYSRGETIEFPLNRVIPGWTEGVQLMSEGDLYRFFVPADLAYGRRGTPGGPIGPNETLVFDVELIKVVK